MPDYSTAESATETYLRAIQTNNVELGVMATAEPERASHEAQLRTLLGYAAEKNFYWKVEIIEGTAHADDNKAVAKVRYVTVDAKGERTEVLNPQGKVIPEQSGWWVFIKQSDGTWRLSPSEGKRLNELDAKNKANADEPH